jgi:fructose-bisphosphate aldolase, class I
MSHHQGHELEATAQALVAAGKGILAADESSGTIKKRFDSIQVESTEQSRRDYREMLFTTPECEQYISGVILFDETIRQQGSDGTPLAKVLEKRGIIPGIKVDKGAKKLPFSDDEKITEGLDGLRERLGEYRGLGARFAKWRAVIEIAAGKPSDACLRRQRRRAGPLRRAVRRGGAGADRGARGPDGRGPLDRALRRGHGAHAALRVRRALRPPRAARADPAEAEHGAVRLRREAAGPGAGGGGATIRCFKRVVPAAVPGVVFLSGGQSDELATAHLNEMNRIGGFPWQMSFSYGRALQAPALKAWRGKKENFTAGQQAFLKRAKLNGEARYGRYTEAMEKAA